MRFAGRVNIEKATTLAYFTNEGLLQHLLHKLKYDGKKEIGTFLGKTLAHDLQQVKWSEKIDAIIPVPLHPKKEATRGFNQAEIIAEGMQEVLNIPVITDVLHRARYTESQTKKTREERLLNMKDAFEVKHREKITGKHLLLIDDVLTTGATLEACAIALSQITNIHISIATIGIAD